MRSRLFVPHSQSASPKRHPTPQIAWHHLGMVHKTLESDFRKNDTISMRSPSLNAITTVKHSLQSFFLLKKLFNKVDPPKHFPFLRPHLVSHFKKKQNKTSKIIANSFQHSSCLCVELACCAYNILSSLTSCYSANT